MACDDIYDALKEKADGRMSKKQFKNYAKKQLFDDCE